MVGDRLSVPMCTVIPEMYGERECDDFGDDGYGYYEEKKKLVDPGHLSMMTHAISVSGMIGVILRVLNNIGPFFPAEVGGDSVLTCCESVLAVDEAVIVIDSCSGHPRARKVLNRPKFRCDPDSDRMLCRQWIPSALDTSVRETGVIVCLLDIPAVSGSHSAERLLHTRPREVPPGVRSSANYVFGPILPDSSRRGLFSERFGLMPSSPVIRAFPLMCFSSANWTTSLFTIIGCSVGCPPHVSFRKDYLTRLRVFATQVSAMDRCGQRSDTGHSSPAPASSGSPRTIRQHDTGAESPRKTRRTSHYLGTEVVNTSIIQSITRTILKFQSN